MGYTTEFSGTIKVEPALGQDALDEIYTLNEERHEGSQWPSIWCDWVMNEAGSEIYWNGSEKTYGTPEWIQYIIKHWVVPNGSVANGEVEANGEEAGDHWKLVVKDNKVSVLNGQIVYE